MVLMSGGYGSGKTTGLALKILQLKAANPGVPGLVVSQTWASLWSITVRRLMAILSTTIPRNLMPRVRSKTDECYLDFGDGVPVYLRSAKNSGSIDGLDVGWACGDELRHWSEESYQVTLSRVRVKCPVSQVAFSSTPSVGFMSNDFDSGKRNRELIVAPTIENERNLTPGFIDNLRLSYSPRLQKAVIEGYFTILEGAVYEALDPDIWQSPWAVNWDAKANLDLKTCLMVDPGYRRSSWIWAQEVKPLNWVVIDQYQPEDATDARNIDVVNNRGWPIDEIWCDPAATATQSAMGFSTAMMLQAVKARTPDPIRYITGPFRNITFGVDKVRTMLGDPSTGLPIRVKFAKSMQQFERTSKRGLCKDLLAYRYPESRDGRPITEEPLKDGITDHSCDAFRYWAVGMWLSTSLRSLDPVMQKMAQNTRGFRVAA